MVIQHIPGVTPSRIRGYPLCNRRWAFANLFGLEEPDSQYAAWGTAMHACIEHYYKTDDLVGAEDIVAAVVGALVWMPKRGKHILIEKEYVYDRVVGTVDLSYATVDTAYVHDWKSCGKISYKKSRNALMKDSQFVIYGLAVAKHFGCEKIVMSWGYICRNANADGTHDSQPVVVETTFTELEEIYNKSFKETVDVMILAQDKTHPSQFEKDKTGKHCWAFGTRCPHEIPCIIADKGEAMSAMEDADLFAEFMDETPEVKPTDINPPDVPLAVAEEVPTPKKKVTKKKPTKKKETQPEPDVKGYTLYLNCTPAKGVDKAMPFANIANIVCTAVQDAQKVDHWALLEYGKGKAYLSAQFRLLATKSNLLDGQAIIVTGHSEELNALQTELQVHAHTIIVGN